MNGSDIRDPTSGARRGPGAETDGEGYLETVRKRAKGSGTGIRVTDLVNEPTTVYINDKEEKNGPDTTKPPMNWVCVVVSFC